MQIKYLGHSAFEISSNNDIILIDPFLECNPSYAPKKISDIFVTHGHGDHLGSAIELSKNFNSKITAIFELANYCTRFGALANGVSFGGKLHFNWGWALFLPAIHSSSTPDGQYAGSPAGILFEIEGVKVFNAGDTCLNTEFKVIKEIYNPQIALLPIGGHFTMDIEQASIAAKWLGVKTVIPMHYNTFPAIKCNPEELKNNLKKDSIVVNILKINESLTV